MKNVRFRLTMTLGFIVSTTTLGFVVFAQQITPTGKRANAPGDVRQEIAALQSADTTQRMTAICSLREKEGAAADAIPYLVQIIGDDTPVNTCGQEGEPTVPASVVAPGSSIGKEAAKTLAAIGKPAVEAVINASGESNWKVRSNAVWTLGEIRASYRKGQEPRTMALLPRLQDERAEVRTAAAWAFAEIKDHGSVPALIAALSDQDAGVRKNAAWALGEMKSDEAVQSLIAKLQDQQAEVRQNSAWALGEIKSRSAIDALTAVLNDESKGVRDAAQFALREIKSGKAK